MAGSQIVLGILQSNSYLRWLRAILWLFFFGSREENTRVLGRQMESHVSMTFMQRVNNKCLPEALYLE